METFPDAKKIFLDRAWERRIEFRRIKKQFCIFADVNPDPEQDAKDILDSKKFQIIQYSDKSAQPPFLEQADFYFVQSTSAEPK